MTRVFIDTNVFVDLVMKREGFVDAAKVFALASDRDFSLHTSVLSMANLAYILRKAIGMDRLYAELAKFDEIVIVETLSKQDYHSAVLSKARDFEDALQFECAKSSKCDILVTRNKKDIPFEGIAVMSPKELLNRS